MIKITIPASEADKLRTSLSDFQICDPVGTVLATVKRDLTPEFTAQLKRRAASPGPWRSSEQVHELLQTLEDTCQDEGALGLERAREILTNLRAKWDA